jgi:hypothetical protein
VDLAEKQLNKINNDKVFIVRYEILYLIKSKLKIFVNLLVLMMISTVIKFLQKNVKKNKYKVHFKNKNLNYAILKYAQKSLRRLGY